MTIGTAVKERILHNEKDQGVLPVKHPLSLFLVSEFSFFLKVQTVKPWLYGLFLVEISGIPVYSPG